MSTVLEARALSREYFVSRGLFSGAASVKALTGVSFALNAGKTLAVVGESGSGKSTLARLLTLIETPTAGKLIIDGEDVADADSARRRRLRHEVQMVFQNPYGSLNPRQTIGKALEEPLLVNTRMRAAEREDAALAIMAKVGLRPEFYHRYPHMFSGGQRQRIAIARALALNPDFIVCDEPTSALDVSIQAQILNLLSDLREKLGLTYLLITHNLAVVRFMAARVGVMYLGRFVEIARTADLFTRPRHPYTRTLLDAVPDLMMSGRARTPIGGEPPNPIDPPPGCPFHPRCPRAIARCRSEVPLFRDNVACHLAHDDPDWLKRHRADLI